MQQQQNDSWRVTTAQSFGMLYIVAQCHSIALTVFTRHSFGTRAFDPFAVFTFFGLYLLAAEHPGFGYFLVAWLVLLIIHRVRSFRLRHLHSRYGGYPWLAMRFPFVKTEWDARRLEPLLYLAIGLLLAESAPALALFIGLGFVSQAVLLVLEELIAQQRLRAMRDAEIELGYYSDRFRGR